MNLHGFVAPYIAIVNPMSPATFYASAGYTTAANGMRTPVFLPGAGVTAQVQELTASDLRQVEGLNLQTHVVAIYLYGSADGVNRINQKGGDLVIIPGGPNAGTYLVAKVLERWPDWTKVAGTLQMPSTLTIIPPALTLGGKMLTINGKALVV